MSNNILELISNNNGYITSTQVDEAGFLRGQLHYLVKTGKLIQSARGVYMLPSCFDDEFLNAQSRYKQGIFSLGSALYLHAISDRTPLKLQMALPNSNRNSNIDADLISITNETKLIFGTGLTSVKTPYGNIVRVYNIERTLCDILRKHKHEDIQIITSAFKEYAKQTNKDIKKLSEYAKLLKVESKLRTYLEVLL